MRILLVGGFKCSQNNAMFARVLHLKNVLETSGNTVTICSGQLSEFPKNFEDEEKDEIYYLNRDVRTPSFVYKIYRYLTTGIRLFRWLQKFSNPFDVILVLGGYILYNAPIYTYSKVYATPVVVDVVEWFQPEHIGGKFSVRNLILHFCMHVLYVKQENVIVISTFLRRHFISKNTNVYLFPPVVDPSLVGKKRSVLRGKELVLSYTGSPGKKDNLNTVIEVMLGDPVKFENVRLCVAGVSESQLLKLEALATRNLSKIPEKISVFGRVSRFEAMEIVKNSDFTVLLRNDQRYANAGFPTKLVESLSVGTPVICNLTSDIGSYIEHLETGIVCGSERHDDFEKALYVATTLSSSDINRLSENSINIVKSKLNLWDHVDPMSEYFENIAHKN